MRNAWAVWARGWLRRDNRTTLSRYLGGRSYWYSEAAGAANAAALSTENWAKLYSASAAEKASERGVDVQRIALEVLQ